MKALLLALLIITVVGCATQTERGASSCSTSGDSCQSGGACCEGHK